MKSRVSHFSALTLSTFLIGLLYAVPSLAGILTISGGQLIGATEVNVGGTLYDVEFKDGTFTSIFGVGPLDATTLGEAAAFSDALLSEVFDGDVVGLDHDSDPTLTAGCTLALLCLILTPYAFDSAGFVDAIGALNLNGTTGDFIFAPTAPILVGTDLSTTAELVWADWNLHSVPEPSTLILLGLGLAGLGFKRRRKQS